MRIMIFAAFAAGAIAAPASGEMYTATITGTITSNPAGPMKAIDERGYFDEIGFRDTIKTTFYYDVDKFAKYYAANAPNSMFFFAFDKAVVTIGEKSLALDKNLFYDYVSLYNRPGQGLSVFFNSYLTPPNELITTQINISFGNQSTYDLQDNVFTGGAGDYLANTGQSIARVNGYNNGTTFLAVDYIPTRLSIAPLAAAAVPEPATWSMMILGMGVVGFAMRRKSKVTARASCAV